MTEQSCCTLCGAAGHRAAQCNWNAPGAPEPVQRADSLLITDKQALNKYPGQAEGAQGERVVQTAPERIYLIVGADCPRDADFSELAEVTWCEDDLDDGIEYVRADKARAALAHPSPAPELVAYADIGRAVEESISVNLPEWSPSDCPSEVVVHLINERDAAQARVAELEQSTENLRQDRKRLTSQAVQHRDEIEALRARLSDLENQAPGGSAEFSQFLSAVMDAAGMVRHGRRSKELSEYLGAQCMKYRLSAPIAQAGQVPQAWLDVQAERRRQITAKGWTPEHDDAHSHGQMARAAACYALAGSSAPNDGTAALLVSLAWPWDEQWWKPTSARRDLVKACALGLAEIERLDRAAAPAQGGSNA